MGEHTGAMKALVTGGGGFLGGAIVRLLRERGDEVRSFSRGDYPQLRALGVETIQGDITDEGAVAKAVAGCDAVFHVAAKAGVWGYYAEFYAPNVIGTQYVIAACRKARVPRLIYTSTPSVTFSGEDQEGVDESAPYPYHFLSHYASTKAEAERLVLAANGKELITVALRPHLIWGPGDTQLVPRIVERAKRGRLRLVGDGQKRVDATYIDNAALAHLLAADKLAPGADCAGRAYFITNGEPWPLAKIVNAILDAAGLPPVTKRIPPAAAYAAGAVLELTYGILGIRREPTMTRFVARQLATAHWYDISAAKRDLGYEPIVSMEEGLRRLRESFGR